MFDWHELGTDSYIGLIKGPVVPENTIDLAPRAKSGQESSANLLLRRKSSAMLSNPDYSVSFSSQKGLEKPALSELATVAEYFYDGDGVMVKSVISSVSTYYIIGYYEYSEDTAKPDETTEGKYYSASGMRIAMRTIVTNTGGSTDTLNWLLGDHLGSTSMVADTNGAGSSESQYPMFGRVYFYNWDDLAYKLTACNYSYIQLIDFNARFYSPTLGRFIQPDTLVPDLTNSQAWNRYTYVLNSPIKYVDPSGHVAVENGEKCLPGSNCDPGMKPWGTIEDKELTDEDLKKMKSSGGLDEWGEKMIDVYTWYRDADGWWNEDGDFTITDFLAVALQIEYGKGPSRVSLWTAVGVSAKYKIMHIGSAYDPRGNFDIYSSMFVYIGERQSMRIVWTNEKINDKSASFMGGFEKWKEFAIAAFPTVNDFNSWDLNPNVPFEFKNYSMYTSAGQVKIANADLGVDQKEKYQSSPYWIDNEPFDGAVLVLTFQQNEYWDQYLAP